MVIRSKTLRLVILTSTVLVTIIIAIQLIWLQKVYLYEEKQFNINVSKSIKSLYDDMELVSDVTDNVQKVIENVNPDVYLLKIDCSPNLDQLWVNLKAELTDFDVYTDCRAAIYTKEKNKYTAEEYINLPDAYFPSDKENVLPLYTRDYSYLALYFPHRGQYILKQMFFWIASSGLLLFVLIGFGFSIFYLYRQKFLNDIQKDFINNVTHEFSTPLTVIDLSADALQKPGIAGNPEKYNKYIESIKYQNEYLKKHIQTLIKTVVTESYHLVLEKTTVYPGELIKKAIVQLEPIVTQKNGTIIFNPIDRREAIFADNDNLYLAIFNIINNAVKYSEEPKIIITTGLHDLKYFISVKDNGIGIAPGEKQNIFKKFYRAQNGNVHNTKGLGLGLYFVKKIIALHHGQIEVNSLEGIGTEFKIILPVN